MTLPGFNATMFTMFKFKMTASNYLKIFHLQQHKTEKQQILEAGTCKWHIYLIHDFYWIIKIVVN